MHPEQFQLYQIQNSGLSAIIYFNMPGIWQPCQIAKLLLSNKMCGFRKGYALYQLYQNINSIKFKMADLRPLIIDFKIYA